MSCPSTAAATASAQKNNLCGTNCYGKTPATYLLQLAQATAARINNLCGTNWHSKTPATYLPQQQQQLLRRNNLCGTVKRRRHRQAISTGNSRKKNNLCGASTSTAVTASSLK
jgi:hypothetical protein